MELETSRLLPASQDISPHGIRRRHGKLIPSGSASSFPSEKANDPPAIADYFLIREPEVLDATKNARVEALPFFDKVKYVFSSGRLLERGKYENAPLSLIESSLGPEIYRASLSHNYDALPWNSDFILRHLDSSFDRSPDKVNNDYASAKYDEHGNQAFVRMWCDADHNRLEIRLHDAARKPNPPAGKKPMTRKDLFAFETSLAIISKLLYQCTAGSHDPCNREAYLSKFVVRERLID